MLLTMNGIHGQTLGQDLSDVCNVAESPAQGL